MRRRNGRIHVIPTHARSSKRLRRDLAMGHPSAAETERRSRIGLGRHHERTGRPACAEIISCVLSGGLRRRLCRANAYDEPGAHTDTGQIDPIWPSYSEVNPSGRIQEGWYDEKMTF